MPRSRRSRDEIDLVYGRGLMTRRAMPEDIQAAAVKGTAIEHGRGMVLAGRIRAFEHVASEGMQGIASISRDEALHARNLPHAAPRFQLVADIFAMGVADIVAEAGRE